MKSINSAKAFGKSLITLKEAKIKIVFIKLSFILFPCLFTFIIFCLSKIIGYWIMLMLALLPYFYYYRLIMIKYVNVYFDTIENQVLTEISLRKDLKNHTLKYSSGGASYELVFDDDTYSSRNYASPKFTIKFWILFIISLVIIIVLTFVGLFLSSGPGVTIFMAVFWPVAGFCVMGFIGFFGSSRGSSVSCSTSSYSGTYISDDYSYSSDDYDSYDSFEEPTTKGRSSIELRDESGSSYGTTLENGRITDASGNTHYWVDEDDGRITNASGDLKGYIKDDGTITDMHGFTKGRITEDGRVVDNVGNTIANNVADLDEAIENLNKS